MRMMQDSFPRNLTAFIVLDSTTFLCKEINEEHTRQIRYILHKGEKTIPENLEKLNFSSVRAGEDFNILSTATKCNADGSRIVEAPNRLNQINVYSPDGSFGKTICVGSWIVSATCKISIPKAESALIWIWSHSLIFSALCTWVRKEKISERRCRKSR